MLTYNSLGIRYDTTLSDPCTKLCDRWLAVSDSSEYVLSSLTINLWIVKILIFFFIISFMK